MLDLTIAIPTFNEEKHIKSCIDSIGANFAQKIFILDSFSKDNTPSIAKKLGAEVINFKWDGKFPKKRNWFLFNNEIRSKWILFLDADELLNEKFKNEIKKILPYTTHKGFYLNYNNYFFGKKLKGGLKMRKLALFQVGSGFYEKIEEDFWSNLDMEVHEHPIINGTLGKINAEIDHKDFNGVARYIDKHNQYSSWEAQRFLKINLQKKNFVKWNLRQKLKYNFVSNPFSGLVFFFVQYFIFGGWKDGLIGFYFAILKSTYYVQISFKIYENKVSKLF
tara:strand:- start:1008 stop:1841 length:834 start_codon:yes stop_codon:yes gene_type:complete